MLAFPARFARQHILHHLLVWVLVVALPINGVSSLLAQMLGAQHRHAQIVPEAERNAVIDTTGLSPYPSHHHTPNELSHPHLHAHAHMMFERHVHEPADGTVLALGAKDSGQDGPGQTNGLSDTMSLQGLRDGLNAPEWIPVVLRAGWPLYAALAWHSHIVPPLERPPHQ